MWGVSLLFHRRSVPSMVAQIDWSHSNMVTMVTWDADVRPWVGLHVWRADAPLISVSFLRLSGQQLVKRRWWAVRLDEVSVWYTRSLVLLTWDIFLITHFTSEEYKRLMILLFSWLVELKNTVRWADGDLENCFDRHEELETNKHVHHL